MQFRNTVSSLKNGWWKLALLAALMALPGCLPLPQLSRNGNLVCLFPDGTVSIAAKTKSTSGVYNKPSIVIATDNHTFSYHRIPGETCLFVTDAEFAAIKTAHQAQGL